MSIGIALSRGLAVVRSANARSVGQAFALKGVSVVLNFTLFFLLARALGGHEFGVFSILFSVAGLFSVFATSGQQILMVRFWNEYSANNDVARLKGALGFSGTTFLFGSLVIGTLVMAGLSFAFPFALVLPVTLYLVAAALLLTTSHLVRAAIGLWLGDGLGSFVPILLAIGYLVFHLSQGGTGNLGTVFYLLAGGAGVSAAIQFGAIWYKLRQQFPDFWAIEARYERRAWAARSLKLWLSNGLEASNQYVDVLIIGLLMTPTIAGAYFVMIRLANVFAVAGSAMHYISSRHIPNFYYRKEHAALDELLDMVAVVNLTMVSAGMLGILVFGHYLLSLFGTEYTSFYPALILLCFGTATVTAVGPAGTLLVYAGHEGAMLAVTAVSVVIRAVAFFVMIPFFAVTGAIAATTASLLFLAIALRYFGRKLTGLDGSVLRLVPPLRSGAAREQAL